MGPAPLVVVVPHLMEIVTPLTLLTRLIRPSLLVNEQVNKYSIDKLGKNICLFNHISNFNMFSSSYDIYQYVFFIICHITICFDIYDNLTYVNIHICYYLHM